MKLVDILARELKEWPEKFGGFAIQAPVAEGKAVWFSAWEPQPDKDGWRDIGVVEHWAGALAEDRKTAIVTRAQWQAAVEALRDPLPPLKNPLPMPNVVPPKQEAIDWSKAPEGATHWDASPNRVGSFMKVSEDGNYFWPRVSDAPRWCSWPRESDEHFIPRPMAWNGEGLPPVGTKCMLAERIGNSFLEQFRGIELEVVMHDVSIDGAQIAVFRCLDPEELSDLEEGEDVSGVSYLYHGVIPKLLKPIRTPEQIAAEEREAAIKEMCAYGVDAGDSTIEMTCSAIFDAGYRKQVQP